jgi:hypothetical protein
VKVDKEKHQAIVAGKFKVEKLLKKLKEKTGKKAEIIQIEEEEEENQGQENCSGSNINHNEFIGANYYENFHHDNHDVNQDRNMLDIMRDITIFSDENANACIIL